MYGKHSSAFQSSGATFLTSDLFQIIRVKDMPVPGATVSVLIRLKSSHARANEVDLFCVVRDASLDDRVFHIHKIQKIPAFVNRDSLHPCKLRALPCAPLSLTSGRDPSGHRHG